MKRPFDPIIRQPTKHLLQQYLAWEAQYRRLAAAVPQAPAATPPSPASDALPYRVNTPFTSADAPLFFGREWETEALLTAVYTQPFVAMMGESGVGKTSLIQAGLLPLLAPQQWEVLFLTLDERPFTTLAHALLDQLLTPGSQREVAQLATALRTQTVSLADVWQRLNLHRKASKRRWLIIVDQLEALFAPQLSASIAIPFLEQLLGLPNVTRQQHLTLLVSVRRHVLGQALAYAPLLQAYQWELATIYQQNAEPIIEQPAAQFGVVYENGLSQQVAADFGKARLSLPLLQQVLVRLWDERENGRLTHAQYEKLGGVSQILRDYAQACLETLPASQQTAARTILQSLAADNDPLPLDILPSHTAKIVAHLVKHHLLILTTEQTGEPIAFLANPLLAREAPPQPVGVAMLPERPLSSPITEQPTAPLPPLPKRHETPSVPSAPPSIVAPTHVAPTHVAPTQPNGSTSDDAPPEATPRNLDERDLHPDVLEDIKRQEMTVVDHLRRDNQRLSRYANLLSLALALALLFLIWVSYSTITQNNSPVNVSNAIAAQATLEVQAAQAVVSDAEKQAALDSSAQSLAFMEAQLQATAAREVAARVRVLLADQPNEALHLAHEAMVETLASGKPPHAALVGALYEVLLQPSSASVLAGHEDWVTQVAYSPDGRFLVTTSGDGTAKLWTADGQLVATLGGHEGWVQTAVFHPNGSHILTAGEDGTAKLWDVQGSLQATVVGAAEALHTALLSPQGNQILTAGEGTEVGLWDLAGQRVATLEHETAVTAAAYSPDSAQIVTATADGRIWLWDAQGEPLATLSGHQARVNAIAFRADSTVFATVSDDNALRLWSRQGGSLGIIAGHSDTIWSVAFSPNGERILTASADGTARLWNEDGDVLTILRHDAWVANALFVAAGERILTADGTGLAHLWQTDGTLLAAFAGHEAGLTAVSLAPDAAQFATASRDGTARLWPLVKQQTAVFAQHNDWVTATAISPSGNFIATASRDGLVQVHDRTGDLVSSFMAHRAAVTAIAFHPDEQQLLTASRDATAALWWLDGTEMATLAGHEDVVQTAVFSPDGSHIVTASSDATAKIWDSAGTLRHTFADHVAPLTQALFSPDGSHILTASQDSTARLWSATGDLRATLVGHNDALAAAAFSPDSSLIATASRDGTASLWNQRGDLQATFVGHTDWVNSVLFAPNGSTLLTSSNDGTARLWQLDGAPLAILDTQLGLVEMARFNEAGTLIMTAGRNGQPELWNEAGEFMLALRGHDEDVETAVFSPHSANPYLITGSRAGTVRRWSLFPDLAAALAEAEKRLR